MSVVVADIGDKGGDIIHTVWVQEVKRPVQFLQNCPESSGWDGHEIGHIIATKGQCVRK